MNWTGTITVLAIITGAYFLWSWISKKEANPTTQEVFSLDRETITDLPVGGADIDLIANEIPATDPIESTTYETVYNITVEAPVIPDLNTGDIIDDIIEDIDINQYDPLPDATGGADKLSDIFPEDDILVDLGKIISAPPKKKKSKPYRSKKINPLPESPQGKIVDKVVGAVSTPSKPSLPPALARSPQGQLFTRLRG